MKKLLHVLIVCFSLSIINACSSDDNENEDGFVSTVKIKGKECHFTSSEGAGYYVNSEEFATGATFWGKGAGMICDISINFHDIDLSGEGRVKVRPDDSRGEFEKIEINKAYPLTDLWVSFIAMFYDTDYLNIINNAFGVEDENATVTFLELDTQKNYVKFKLSNLTLLALPEKDGTVEKLPVEGELVIVNYYEDSEVTDK